MDKIKLRAAMSSFLEADEQYTALLRGAMDSGFDPDFAGDQVRGLKAAQQKRDDLELNMYAVWSHQGDD